MTQFLFVVHGTDGDVHPVVRIGHALHTRGHRAVILTHEYYRTTVTAAGLDFVPIDTVDEYEAHLADAARQHHSTDIRDFRHHYDRTGLFTQLRYEVAELTRRHEPHHTVLVGTALAIHSVLIAAEALHAPAVCLFHSPWQVGHLPKVAWLYEQVLADRITTARADAGLPPVGDWTRWMWSADRHIGLWPTWFDHATHPAPDHIQLAGFVLADGTATGRPPPGLTDGAPLLVTGGTGRLLDRDYYDHLIAALADVGHPALLVARHRDLIPATLPPGIRWYPRLPFPQIAPHTAAVIHHGGIGTTARALAAGTRQVVLADGLDRPDNAARLAALGHARWLPREQWTTTAIATAIRDVLSRPAPGPADVTDGATTAAVQIEAALPQPVNHHG
ncbi:glycosyltransferase [Actinoplanes derwentensis]|uniref:UDP:flavonoid glycosyltransferase YjiC, YdhE family n=1 Tax=Actinoplanes derwentensis TaxID=113562 RepID=A0A1H1W850_9ACTN|nr:nucleotide disphospho-sugar-binding domain-containing protein [Actinoplanes derwentensis]GID84085.1 UDP-glucoronosyl and UDP-glucosyl transferase [Actinoplanes derwentensis]SDS93254.1 UDP:flavonoid glycosyltransferase YjiC, YdhE family [Actinoplanes derwentensis]